MAKTKISEFSATPGNNTDIDGINIAEGCAPSGINDAIRELMAQLKDFQTGAQGDSFNGPIGTSTAAAGAFTTLTTSSTVTHNAGTANGVAYLNGSKVLTSGSALTFDGTNFATTGSVTSAGASNSGNLTFTGTGNRITGDFSNATIANRVAFQTSTSNAITFVAALPNGTGTNASFGAWGVNDPTNSIYLAIRAFGTTETRIDSGFAGTASAAPLTIYTGGSERMRINSSGNVGIGTSSPSNPLTVRSSGTSTSAGGNIAARIESNGSGYASTLQFSDNVANSSYISMVGSATAFGQAGTERMRIDSSGNVGIGTSSPATKLHVSGTSAETIRYQSTSSAPYQTFYNSSANRAGYIEWNTSALKIDAENGASSTMAFLTANNERMRIDSSGNLLVGTTTNITGNAKFNISQTGSGTWAQFIQVGNTTNGIGITNTSGTTGYNALSFYNNGTSFNNVGTISANTSSTSYNTSSDYRLKENIAPMTGALAVVAQLNPVTYNWKADGSAGQGFIAHELQAIVPDCVTGEKDAVDAEGKPQYQGVDTSFLVATLTAAIKEQQAIIESLKSRLDAANL